MCVRIFRRPESGELKETDDSICNFASSISDEFCGLLIELSSLGCQTTRTRELLISIAGQTDPELN